MQECECMNVCMYVFAQSSGAVEYTDFTSAITARSTTTQSGST